MLNPIMPQQMFVPPFCNVLVWAGSPLVHLVKAVRPPGSVGRPSQMLTLFHSLLCGPCTVTRLFLVAG